jgi:hypothetical protein
MLREQMINFLQPTVIFLLITNAFTTAAAVCAIRLLAGPLCKSGLRSVLVSQNPDRGDEAVAAPFDVDDKPIPIASVPQRAAQRGNMDREVGGLDN